MPEIGGIQDSRRSGNTGSFYLFHSSQDHLSSFPSLQRPPKSLQAHLSSFFKHPAWPPKLILARFQTSNLRSPQTYLARLLREAPLLSGVLNLKCSCFVLVLRKIIDFCEGEMEGPRIVLPTGSLTHRFFGVRKVDPPKLALATGIGRFRDPFFGRGKSDFFGKNAKSSM